MKSIQKPPPKQKKHQKKRPPSKASDLASDRASDLASVRASDLRSSREGALDSAPRCEEVTASASPHWIFLVKAIQMFMKIAIPTFKWSKLLFHFWSVFVHDCSTLFFALPVWFLEAPKFHPSTSSLLLLFAALEITFYNKRIQEASKWIIQVTLRVCWRQCW